MSFIEATRQSIRPLDSTLPYSDGGRSVARLPRTGLLSRIYLHVSGTATVTPGTGTATVSPKGPYNLIRSLSVKANQGTEIVRLNGFSAHILDVISAGKMYEPDDGQRGTNPVANVLYSAPVASGYNDWEFTICINITPNDRDLAGLLLLQTDQMAAELEINWAPFASTSIDTPVVLTGNATATFTGQATAHLETFTVPADPANRPDLTTIYQQLERVDPISNLGENRIDFLRANLYARIVHVIEINGQMTAPSDIDRFRLRYNNDNTPYEITTPGLLALQRRRYGRDLPQGVFVWDLFYQGIPGYGGMRDLINAGTVAEFAGLINVASNANLGSGNNYIRSVTQQFVTLGGPQR